MQNSHRALRGEALRVDRFLLRTLKRFNANQGFLLAGALAYYILLSLIPLVTFLAVVLSKFVDQRLLLTTAARYLRLLVPGEAGPLLTQIRTFLAQRTAIGFVLLADMLFFSAMAISTLESSMRLIFRDSAHVRPRSVLASILMPYLYVPLLGLGLLVATLAVGTLQAIQQTQITLFGHVLPLTRLSIGLAYSVSFLGEVIILTFIYFAMPFRNLPLRRAFIGGLTAAVLWDVTRYILVWYFAHISPVNVLYGSLSTVVVGLFTLEVASIILLFGAQVIAEYERTVRVKTLTRRPPQPPPQ
ncbi:MAG: YihY/virulence factor BrkB family protein [Betaproteobacteria bacterium]|nr:YihY/virulence factor BrkB family protein [Betaproteobacteria bacterium]